MANPINQAIRAMAQSPNGGYAVTAAMLGMTQAALENRLYEVKGQKISISEAMLMQRMTERTDFAEAVAAESGGVFVCLPELSANELCGKDITESFLAAYAELGGYTQQWQNITADGSVCSTESAALWQQLRGVVAHLAAIAVLTDQVFGEDHAR